MKQLFLPVRLKPFYPKFAKREFRLLDVGCGNRSPSVTKKYFPKCEYHGLDKIQYNINEEDLSKIDQLYSIDLNKDRLSDVPDAYFDAVLVSHVLEHLENPIDVLEELCKKIKKEGLIYLEFPSIKSLGLPSREGTLQFCDDETHIHLPNPYDIANRLLKSGLKIIKAGIRRDPIRLMSAPLFLMQNILRRLLRKKPRSKGLWDLYGFAYFFYAKKVFNSL